MLAGRRAEGRRLEYSLLRYLERNIHVHVCQHPLLHLSHHYNGHIPLLTHPLSHLYPLGLIPPHYIRLSHSLRKHTANYHNLFEAGTVQHQLISLHFLSSFGKLVSIIRKLIDRTLLCISVFIPLSIGHEITMRAALGTFHVDIYICSHEW